ncbi:MAG TPA: hypothetical protein VFI46_09690, partial [Jiangellaceae bacterium]|nr:hypothetical protein [Jiangellaceae bacterium]
PGRQRSSPVWCSDEVMATPSAEFRDSTRSTREGRSLWVSRFQESQLSTGRRGSALGAALRTHRPWPGSPSRGTIEPLWNLYDLTPAGRGTGWDEQLTY